MYDYHVFYEVISKRFSYVHTINAQATNSSISYTWLSIRNSKSVQIHAYMWNTSLSAVLRKGSKQARDEHSQRRMFWLAALEAIVKLFIITIHFPSHLCMSSSNSSVRVLASRAKPVPWLLCALAFHSHFLSHPVEMKGSNEYNLIGRTGSKLRKMNL